METRRRALSGVESRAGLPFRGWDGLLFGLPFLAIGVGNYNRLLAICFDEEFARLRGVRVEMHYLLLLCLTALTVVVLVTVVGLVMVIALLTLPVAIANRFAHRLWQVMAVAATLVVQVPAVGEILSWLVLFLFLRNLN